MLTTKSSRKEECGVVKTQYVDTALLDDYIEKSGLRIAYICEQLGISRQAFDKKRKGMIAFRQSEIYVVCDLLHITDVADKTKIFFTQNVSG